MTSFLAYYYFLPVAIKTTGVYAKSTATFLSCLAKKLVDLSGDPRELLAPPPLVPGSVAVVRGKAASI